MSNLLLPIGSLIYLLFCVSKWGWGFDKYLAEANKGTGLGMSPRFKIYFQFILPMLILVILLVGLGSWGWRALICAAVAVFVWFMARRSSSKSTIERSDLSKERTVKDGPLFASHGSFAWNSPWQEQQRYSFAPPRSWGMRNSLPCSGYSRASSSRSGVTQAVKRI